MQHTTATPTPRTPKGNSNKAMLIGLSIVAILVLVVGGFFVLGGDADLDTEGGDVDVEAPSVDADVSPPDIDIEGGDLPDVDVEGGDLPDVDVQGGDAEAETDPPVSATGG